jgi:hypothetical protein
LRRLDKCGIGARDSRNKVEDRLRWKIRDQESIISFGPSALIRQCYPRSQNRDLGHPSL